ncbi:MAG: protein kinase [Verrucomicrobia bacterium]|nr:protein kinase [Verrucomicrobiota bacterium]
MAASKAHTLGDYELLGEIARGAMGVVYRARQRSLNRLVALKMILAGELASEVEVQRFRREAEAAANLDHANIVPIYEVGEHEGQHYFSMRLVDGDSLNGHLSRYHQDIRAAAQLMATVARAVHHAHQRGILHRDIKPGNILIDSQGEPHVTDFGLAKRVDVPSDLTQSESIMGTPNHMSPEQAQGRNKTLTTATDVWSLGGVLYRLVTGQVPFPADTTWEMLRAIVEKEPVQPRTLNRQVDADLETICLKCLEKDPERRYLSAAALAEDLERWLRREPIQAKPSTYRDRIVKWSRRKPLIASLAVSLCLVAVLGFFGILWQWQEARTNAARAQKALAESYVSQAQARRMSGSAGQRTESLRALTRAQAYYTNEAVLRDQVIAAMALPDLAEFAPGLRLSNRAQAFEMDLDAHVAAEAGTDGTIRIRSLKDGGLLRTLPGRGAEVSRLRFGPGGSLLLVEHRSQARGQITVWDWERELTLLAKEHGIHAEALDFNAATNAVAVGRSDGRVFVYAIPGGEIHFELELRLPSGTPRVPHVVRLHPSGTLLAESSLDDLYVQIWDLEASEPVARLPHADVVHGLAWDPGGEFLAAACRDANLYLWSTNAPNRPKKLSGHEGPVIAVAFNPSGTFLASLGLDETVRLWVPATERQLIRRLDGESFERLQFNTSGRLLMATDQAQRNSRVWETFGEEYRALRLRGNPASQIITVDFSPNGQWLVVANGEQASIWAAGSGREFALLPLQNAKAAWISADSQFLLVSANRGLFSCPVTGGGRGGTPAEAWPGVASELGTMAVTPDRSLAAIAHHLEILLVSLNRNTNTVARTYDVGFGKFEHLALHPKSRWVAGMTKDSNDLYVLDLSDPKRTRPAARMRSSQYFAFSPSGEWLVACWGGKYEFYQVDAWRRPAFVISRKTASDQHAPVAFTRDGTLVAIASTRYVIQLFRLPQRGTKAPRLVATLEAPDLYPLELLAFSPDGRRVAAAAQNQTVMLWNLALIGEHLAEMNLHTNRLAFP